MLCPEPKGPTLSHPPHMTKWAVWPKGRAAFFVEQNRVHALESTLSLPRGLEDFYFKKSSFLVGHSIKKAARHSDALGKGQQ